MINYPNGSRRVTFYIIFIYIYTIQIVSKQESNNDAMIQIQMSSKKDNSVIAA